MIASNDTAPNSSLAMAPHPQSTTVLSAPSHPVTPRGEVRDILDLAAFDTVFQPFVNPRSGATRGYEALTRFHNHRRPDLVFAQANSAGLSVDLEVATTSRALSEASCLAPAHFLSLNLSPSTILATPLGSLLASARRPVVVEVTEHEEVTSYPDLRHTLDALGDVRVAIDDFGVGFASWRHVIDLRADIIKVDASLVRSTITSDRARAALSAIASYATATATTLVLEGVETPGELDILLELTAALPEDLLLVQGYFFARPAPASLFVA